MEKFEQRKMLNIAFQQLKNLTITVRGEEATIYGNALTAIVNVHNAIVAELNPKEAPKLTPSPKFIKGKHGKKVQKSSA